MIKKTYIAYFVCISSIFTYSAYSVETLLQDIKQQMSIISDRLQTIQSAQSIRNKLDLITTTIDEIKSLLPLQNESTLPQQSNSAHPEQPIIPSPEITSPPSSSTETMPVEENSSQEEIVSPNISDIAQQTPLGPILGETSSIETIPSPAPESLSIPTSPELTPEFNEPASSAETLAPSEPIQEPLATENDTLNMTVDATVTDLPSEAPSIMQVLSRGKIDENQEIELKSFLQNKERAFEEKFPGPEFLALVSDLNLLFAYAQAIQKYKELFDESVKKKDKEAATRLQTRIEETKQKYSTTVKKINTRYGTVEWYKFYTKE